LNRGFISKAFRRKRMPLIRHMDLVADPAPMEFRPLNIEEGPLVSLLLNTIDRYDLTVRCVGGALANCGYSPVELLVCDNGSRDYRVTDWLLKLNSAYLRINEKNEGCAQMHNQMLLRAAGQYFCLLDNDIELYPGWLSDLVDSYRRMEDAYIAGIVRPPGIAAIYTTGLSPEQHPADCLPGGMVFHPAPPPKQDAAFGTRLFDRVVLGRVGYFCEDYGTYGLCDNEYNSRVYSSGFINYYIDGPPANHLGVDVGENSEYRRMKDESLRIAAPKLNANLKRYEETGDYYLPAPEMR
jgi:glycosyltransferase involved in cell wall biosynthesis